MFVQCICKNRNEKEKNELYQVFGALANREKMQIEEKADEVVIYACPQGTIHIREEDDSIWITANTRHAGPGFHAFAVEFCKDVQTELPGEYELIDDLDFDQDENFHRLHRIYEDEIAYIKDLLLKNPEFRKQNYMYDETYFLPIEREDRIYTAARAFDIDEFRQMTDEELLDSFYVWNTWDKDAQFYKNAALVLLAKEGVGPYTMMNDHTRKYADTICDYLEIAHKMDDRLPLPVPEYNELCQQLGRKPKITGISAERDVSQYRRKDVYHLFEDARIVADGACERNYDPVTQSICLMGPYTDLGEWNWLIQAGKQSVICTKLNEVQKQEPIQYHDKTIQMYDWKEDGITHLEAILRQGDRVLYFHDVASDASKLPYLKQCVKESEFQKEL
ncbi:hypothetical protein [Catenisphaera adipataccumulans]|uniref:Uncharacterized protein n=1 Tax=Catenisphaera adipataccumulans TaxID=700500 RepID=A0A7W8FWS8_9FIRM|nr:hypothetical protein [Catenisphaera adipataccumulans]MBB5182257.1 hypothetical protein [Catenisphaera adipataccumulans]